LQLIVRRAGNDYAARRRELFQPSRNVNAISHKVVTVYGDISEVDAHPKDNTSFWVYTCLSVCNFALDCNCAGNSVNGRAEFDESSITHEFYDTPAMFDQ
jgi:hypothetical protein